MKKQIKLDDDLNSLGIWVPIETGIYTLNDALEGNLSALPDSIRKSLIKKIHALGLKFDIELTVGEMQERTLERENIDFTRANKAHRIDFAYSGISPIKEFIDTKGKYNFAMKRLPNTEFIDKEEAEAWLRLVYHQKQLVDNLEKENKEILSMLKRHMDVSILEGIKD